MTDYPIDFSMEDKFSINIMISADGRRLWLCSDNKNYPPSLVRVHKAKNITIRDDRSSKNLNKELDACAACLWSRDYPNGGSMYKKYTDTPFHDKEIYRKEAEEILKAGGLLDKEHRIDLIGEEDES